MEYSHMLQLFKKLLRKKLMEIWIYSILGRQTLPDIHDL